MQILDLMNAHDDWEEIISQPPYCITVKRDGEYILLKYRQFDSNFNEPIVRECRGIILRQDANGKYVCVCRAFDKFANYGENYADDIDWKTTVVEEKVDGNLIRIFYDNGKWRIATNGTIDAFKAIVDDMDYTFGDLVLEALDGRFHAFTSNLEHNTTYMFELVSPKSTVTIEYPETKLYYLGQRDMTTMREYKLYDDRIHEFGVLRPKLYHISTIEACIDYVNSMTKDEEGFVIRDGHFNRVKLKSPQFLMHFHMDNNGKISTKRIIRMIQNEQIDDFLAYCTKYKDRVVQIYGAIEKIAYDLENVWEQAKKFNRLNRKEFVRDVHAMKLANFPHVTYIMLKYDHPDLNPVDFILSRPISKIRDLVKKETVNGD